VEPFTWTGIVITSDHLSETDLVTIAVSWLTLFVFVVTLVE
jgi:hypothetical protein